MAPRIIKSVYKLTTQNNFALAQSRNALIVIMNVPKTISLSQSRNTLVVIMNIPRAISYPSKTISLSGKQSRNALIMQSEFELAVIVIANNYNIARSKYKHTLCILRSIWHLCKKKFAFTPSKSALVVIMNIPRSISQPCKTISLSHKVQINSLIRGTQRQNIWRFEI